MTAKLLACIVVAAVLAADARAQRPPVPEPLGVFVRTTDQRWLYGRQRAEFTPVQESEAKIDLTGISRDRAKKTRTLSLDFSVQSRAPGTARVTTDEHGRVVALTAEFPREATAPGPIDLGISKREMLGWVVFDGIAGQFAALPATRVWDLVPARRAIPIVANARWRDTVDLSTSLNGYRQSLRGVRDNVVVADTVVRGKRLWIVRDSTVVHYAEHLPTFEHSLDTTAVVDRSGDGIIVGRHLYDPVLELDHWRADTMRLTGTASLSYPDGRSFHTPARYERTRRIVLEDDSVYQKARAERNARNGEFSVVIRPTGDVERIQSGDTALITAFLDTITVSHDPSRRSWAYGVLRAVATPQLETRLQAALLQSGDTATVLRDLARAWNRGRHPIDSASVALLLPVLADPGTAFAMGLDRDANYDNARQAMLTRLPAATPDTSNWPCAPSACNLVAAQWNAEVDPRLQSLALLTRFALDPKRWADTVVARYKAGDHFLAPAMTMIDGVVADWPAGSHAPLPSPGADWRAWSNWMDGRNAAYARMGPGQLVRFENDHRLTIALAHTIRGRDFAAEWQDGLRAATSDSARLVFASMLVGIGAPPDDVTTIPARLESGSPMMRALAQREVTALLDSAPPVDSVTTAEVQDRVLSVAIDGTAPWAALSAVVPTPGDRSPMPRKVIGAMDLAYDNPAPTGGTLVLQADELSPSVKAKWAARKIMVTEPGWHGKSSESMIVISVSKVRGVGNFASVTINHSHLSARVDGRGQSWAAGTTLYLMRRGNDWVIVGARQWIT